ncbi:globin [Sphingomonas panacisoli]|uniref:Globin n=1 Tax=Sphingomonas panacisoli TaxID=1813879 RepID=A0A5B8LLP2_9SPHN|nr:globin [Sphingomonas panacisoli]QDZ08615.1 globin [Sphingomonas panacisoli]
MTDAALIEASLLALDGQEAAMRERLFERFFARFPDRRAIFLAIDATSVRMTDETLQWMLGLASERKWVWSQVAELVFNHRNYGHLTHEEYAVFIDLAIDALGETIVDAWDEKTDAAWRRQAATLKDMIARAQTEWTAAPLAYP